MRMKTSTSKRKTQMQSYEFPMREANGSSQEEEMQHLVTLLLLGNRTTSLR